MILSTMGLAIGSAISGITVGTMLGGLFRYVWHASAPLAWRNRSTPWWDSRREHSSSHAAHWMDL